MHSIDREFTTLQNPYYGGNVFDEKPIQIKLIKKNHINKLGSQSKNIFRSVLGETKIFDCSVENNINLAINNENVLSIPFEKVEYIQFGIIRSLGYINWGNPVVPTPIYSMLIYIKTVDSHYGFFDFSINKYSEYKAAFQDHNIPLEDPFNLNELSKFEKTKLYDYLNKNYDELSKKANYID